MNRSVATISNIQSLRGLAATMVVIIHTVNMNSEYGFKSDILRWIAGWGEQGVDIFFVISGFVMVLTQCRKNRGVGAFIMDRIIRIVPSYWLLTISLSILVFAFPQIFQRLSIDIPLFVRSMTFTNLYFLSAGGAPMPILYVGWTLEYEMFFYLVFALCLVFRKWSWRIAAQFAVLLGMTLSGLMSNLCLEFLLGELLALFYLSGRDVSTPAVWAMGLAGLLGLLLLAPLGRPLLEWLAHYRLIAFGIPAFLLVTSAVYAKQVQHPLLTILGDASYSIYLVQVFSLSAGYKLARMFVPDSLGTLAALLCMVVSLAAGVLFYWAIERPMFIWIRQITSRWFPQGRASDHPPAFSQAA